MTIYKRKILLLTTILFVLLSFISIKNITVALDFPFVNQIIHITLVLEAPLSTIVIIRFYGD